MGFRLPHAISGSLSQEDPVGACGEGVLLDANPSDNSSAHQGQNEESDQKKCQHQVSLPVAGVPGHGFWPSRELRAGCVAGIDLRGNTRTHQTNFYHIEHGHEELGDHHPTRANRGYQLVDAVGAGAKEDGQGCLSSAPTKRSGEDSGCKTNGNGNGPCQDHVQVAKGVPYLFALSLSLLL